MSKMSLVQNVMNSTLPGSDDESKINTINGLEAMHNGNDADNGLYNPNIRS